MRVGAGLAEAADGGHDEGRVGFAEGVEAEADGVQIAGGLAFNDEGGGGGEAFQGVSSGVAVQVQSEAALIGVEVHEVEAAIGAFNGGYEGAEATGGVTLGGFDLDDIGAHVSEQFGGEGTEFAGEVEYAQAAEGGLGRLSGVHIGSLKLLVHDGP